MKLVSFKTLRFLVLLMLLAGAAIYTQGQRFATQGWYKPLQVVIFPINADGYTATEKYIKQLKTKDFIAIDEFIARESEKYDVISSTPTVTRLGSTIDAFPPVPPAPGSSTLSIILWSLRLRWWTFTNTPDDVSNKERVRIFALYQQGREGVPLKHSLGLQKGLVGIVHVYALQEQTEQNNIVIAHELLHTVGATDKYGPNGHPMHPDGYAQPNQAPLHPQHRAEIMAGRIPLSSNKWKMAESLKSVVVGPQTAQEIKWIDIDG